MRYGYFSQCGGEFVTIVDESQFGIEIEVSELNDSNSVFLQGEAAADFLNRMDIRINDLTRPDKAQIDEIEQSIMSGYFA